jgi:hypothetical protein
VIVLDGPPAAARPRKGCFQLLNALLDWPPGDPDSVVITNDDLVRYVGWLRGISQPALTPTALPTAVSSRVSS